MNKRIVTGFAAATLAALGFTLTACGSDDSPKPHQDQPTVSSHVPDPEKRDLTLYAVETAWQNSDSSEKVDTCNDLRKLGHKGAEDKLREATDNDPKMDYVYAIDLLVAYCTQD